MLAPPFFVFPSNFLSNFRNRMFILACQFSEFAYLFTYSLNSQFAHLFVKTNCFRKTMPISHRKYTTVSCSNLHVCIIFISRSFSYSRQPLSILLFSESAIFPSFRNVQKLYRFAIFGLLITVAPRNREPYIPRV